MSRTTTARGALRSLLAATPPLRTTILIRSITQTAAKMKPTPVFSLLPHSLRASPKRGSIWQRLRFFHNSRARKNKPTSPSPGSPSSVAVEAEPQTLGAKMRKLTREYGWSAAGVYFTLSVLDIPLCYLLVKTLGTERISKWEYNVVSKVKQLIPESVKQKYHDWRTSGKETKPEEISNEQISKNVEKAGWSVEEAEQKYKMNASLATQLALAFAIHKSFIFVRVPLAAAVTPNVVRLLRGWGWDIGKRTTKEVKAIKRAHRALPKSKSETTRKP